MFTWYRFYEDSWNHTFILFKILALQAVLGESWRRSEMVAQKIDFYFHCSCKFSVISILCWVMTSCPRIRWTLMTANDYQNKIPCKDNGYLIKLRAHWIINICILNLWQFKLKYCFSYIYMVIVRWHQWHMGQFLHKGI